ncbi:type I restriction endonuclease, partial [Enterococcus faecium]|nr:type I restriction endonuclease [Enterococcus faecium]
MPKFDEAQLEQAIIELFVKNGYDYVSGESIHRKYDEVLLFDDLKSFMLSKYPDLNGKELEIITNKLKFVPTSPLYIGNRQAFFLVNEGFDLARDDTSKPPIHIDFI